MKVLKFYCLKICNFKLPVLKVGRRNKNVLHQVVGDEETSYYEWFGIEETEYIKRIKVIKWIVKK